MGAIHIIHTSIPYRPHVYTIWATRLYHIGHTSIPYQPHVYTISATCLYHISHTSIPYQPHVYTISATGHTILANQYSQTFGHIYICRTFLICKKCQIRPHSWPYRPNQNWPQTNLNTSISAALFFNVDKCQNWPQQKLNSATVKSPFCLCSRREFVVCICTIWGCWIYCSSVSMSVI